MNDLLKIKFCDKIMERDVFFVTFEMISNVEI